jgi:hypothetical protein
VRFEAAGEPVHSAFCHCESCRRATGAPLSVWVGFAAGCVAIDGPLARRACRGRVVRGFCAECGGALTYADGDIPGDELYLAGGAFDDPDRVPPSHHSYWAERVSWLAITDDLPRHAGTSRRRVSSMGGEAPAGGDMPRPHSHCDGPA